MTCPYPTKTAFTSERQAKRALRALRNPQGRMHVYQCGDHHHLGHRDKAWRGTTRRRRNA